MRTIVLAVVLIAELLTWAAIGWVVAVLCGGGTVGVVGGLLAVVVVTIGWARWASPRAQKGAVARRVVKGVVYGAGVIGLAVVGRLDLSAALLVVVLLGVVGAALTRPNALG